MTAPADDCGVSGGCGACPLGRAGVCGDPVPGGTQLTIEGALAEAADAYVDEALARIGREVADMPDVDPAEPRPEGAGCCGGRCGSGLEVVITDEGDPVLTN